MTQTEHEFRRIPEDQYDKLQEFIQYAFWPQQGAAPEDWQPLDDIDERFGVPYGLYDGDELVYSFHARLMDAQIRGQTRQAALLCSLVVPPENRGERLTGSAVTNVYNYLSKEGVNFGFFWPFSHRFYFQYGYRPIHTVSTYEFAPSAVSRVLDDVQGEFGRIGPDDWRELQPIYEAYVDRYSAPIQRPESWWRNHIFQPGTKTMHTVVWSRDGEDRGYMVYRVIDGKKGQRLAIHDLAYRDYEAFRHLLEFISRHSTQVAEVSLTAPSDLRLLDMVNDPSSVSVSTKLGAVASVYDVAGAATNTPVSEDVEGAVAVRVSNPVIEDADAIYRIETESGRLSCEQVDESPDVTFGVGEFTQLLVGYRSVFELAETSSMVSIENPAAATTLDALLPSTPTHVFDDF